jgi:glycine cleavage system H protein
VWACFSSDAQGALKVVHYEFAAFIRRIPAMAYPTNFRYTREHEWISLDGKIGTIGITDYAQNSLGDIVYVDSPKVGDHVTANATFGSVESVKAVSDLYSPVTGTVTEVNEELKTAPDKINEAPHETWIIKVELSDPSEFEKLLDAAAYEKFVSEEVSA